MWLSIEYLWLYRGVNLSHGGSISVLIRAKKYQGPVDEDLTWTD